MLKPKETHLVQGRAVEIRQSDGGKPSDSFIVKKNEKDQPPEKEKQPERESKRDDGSRSRRRKR